MRLFRRPRQPSIASLLSEGIVAYAAFPRETQRSCMEMMLRGWNYSPEEIAHWVDFVYPEVPCVRP